MALTSIIVNPGDGSVFIGPVTRTAGIVSSVIGADTVHVDRSSSGVLSSLMSYEDDFDSIFTLSVAFVGYDFSIDSISVGISTSSTVLLTDRQLSNDSFNLEFALNNVQILTGRVIDSSPFSVSLSTNDSLFFVARQFGTSPFNLSFASESISTFVDRVFSNTPFNTGVVGQDTFFGIARLVNAESFNVSLAESSVDFSITSVTYTYPLASEVRFGVIFGPDGDHRVGTFIGFDQTEITSGRSTIRLGKNVTLLR